LALDCPKERFWNGGKCWGSALDAPENFANRTRTGYNNHPLAQHDDSCCYCPRNVAFDPNTRRCMRLRAFNDSRTHVGRACCAKARPSRLQRDLQSWGEIDFGSLPSISMPSFSSSSSSSSTSSSSSSSTPVSTPVNTRTWLADWRNAANTDYSPATYHQGSSKNTTVQGLCKNFYDVWNAYPPAAVESDDLLKIVGFGSWVTNTCTLRASIALSGMGLYPGVVCNSKFVAKKKKYLLRVAEGSRFLEATFGRPYAQGKSRKTEEYEALGMDQKKWLPPAEIMGKPGMIQFADCIFSDATGHIDVWDGQHIREEDYFHRCRTAKIYNLCAPLPRPDYTSFIAYVRSTQ